MEQQYVFLGNPPAKKNRYRATQRGGYIHLYKDPSIKAYEKSIYDQWLKQKPDGINVFTGNLEVDIKIYFRANVSDFDGAITTILDCLQGLVYPNDKQIVCFGKNGKFIDSKNPRIEITIREIEWDLKQDLFI